MELMELPEITPFDVPDAARDAHPESFVSPSTAGRFHNPWPHEAARGLAEVLKWKRGKNPHRKKGDKQHARPPVERPLARYAALETELRVFWPGHASFWFAMGGLTAAIDPIFGRAGGLVPRVTPLPCAPAELPTPNVVLITHGHLDHLDAGSVRQLAKRTPAPLFAVPKGMKRMLPSACKNVLELTWWESFSIGGIRFTFVPSQHWHRRGAADTDRALWGAWVAEGPRTLYHSGDTAHFGGFGAIGLAFDIDVAILPLGAYEPRWFMGGQHMAPEDSVRAFEALRARHFLGMHWGTFDLSDEPVDAGPKLLQTILDERGLPHERFHVLEPGGSLGIGDGAPVVHGASALLDRATS